MGEQIELAEHLRTLTADQRERLAARCKTSVAYLYQIAGKHRRPSVGLAEAIEKETDGRVSKVSLVFGDAA